MPNSLWPHGLQPTRLLCSWDFPGKDTGVDCHFLLQGVFPNPGIDPGLLHCRQILYQLSYEGSPYKIPKGLTNAVSYRIFLSSEIFTCVSLIQTTLPLHKQTPSKYESVYYLYFCLFVMSYNWNYRSNLFILASFPKEHALKIHSCLFVEW